MDQLTATALILAIALGFHALFALYFYRRYLGDGDSKEGPPDELDDIGSATEPSKAASNGGSEERSEIPCPGCGTPNDPSFQFCCRCVADLSEKAPAREGFGNRSSS